ncbi:cysteine synthase A [Sphingopyxis sp. OAS728]|uniref:PLP-dependent cysteine synthase family protein n=1 Tax=Sphingopyxis sp. OAS728 TaxID=2663823 RepID=UPI001789A35B|nr:cysteine synthase family protein [Sphingopyxis sp. OAS728]MBE1527994.1 cysteine synthase A [Sphingopyxis sp. OAS728]
MTKSDHEGRAPAVANSSLDLIGRTPLVALDRIHRGPGRIFAKMESMQPGGSMKDRAARACIDLARTRGHLAEGQPVVEMTSGNMGAALAVVCNMLGHPFHAYMSVGNSPERAKMMRALGAKVVLVPQVDGKPSMVTGQDIAAAADRARRAAEEMGAYFVDQFANEGVVLAHQLGTGPEIEAQLGMAPDAFVSVVGTGGTFIGVARHLKSVAAETVCVAVEPAGAEVLAGKVVEKPAHQLQGSGYAIRPPLWDDKLADLCLCVTDEEATDFRARLAREESIYAGFTAAANICASVKLLRSGILAEDAVVATVICDTGLKY